MSSYITFRKGEVELTSYSRSTKIYQLLREYATFDTWKPLTEDILVKAHAEASEQIREYEDDIELHEDIFEGLTLFDDRYNVATHIQGCRKEIEELTYAKVILDFLLDCIETENPPHKLEFIVD